MGDPKDGDALAGLMAGLSDHGFRSAVAHRVEHRVQPDDRASGSALVNTFPVHRATMVSTKPPAGDASPRHVLHLHEVYWGDLSRVKGTAVGLLLGVFDLMFGMRHIASAASADALATGSQIGPWPARLTWLAGLSAQCAEHLARGPMLAMNILLAAVALLQGLLGQFGPSLPLHVEHAASLLAPILVLLAAWSLRSALRKRQWSLATLHWLMILSGAAFVLAAVLRHVDRPQAFVEVATTAMSLGALLMAVAAVAMMLISVLAVLAAGRTKDSSPMPAGRSEMARALVAMNFSTAFGVGLFVLTALVAWTAVGTQVGPPLGNRITEGLHLFALVWLAFLGAAGAFLVIAWLNERLKTQGSTAERHRYIVNTWVWVVFLGLSLLYAGLFIPLVIRIEVEAICLWSVRTPGAAIDRFMDEFRPCVQAWWGWDLVIWLYAKLIQPVESLRGVAVALTLALLAAGAAMRAHALQALDLLLDVVAHFQTGPAVRDAAGGSTSTYPAWDGITRRFKDVLETVGRVDRIVVVTHSQGTIVALHALGLLGIKDRPAIANGPSVAEIDLVTMGSPADHLYRYYMPRTYGEHRESTCVSQWLNVYRLDDFIGTKLGFDAGPAPHPFNQPVAPRGHADYWRDREVLQYLVPFLARPAATQRAPV